jgi:hypothetical protein
MMISLLIFFMFNQTKNKDNSFIAVKLDGIYSIFSLKILDPFYFVFSDVICYYAKNILNNVFLKSVSFPKCLTGFSNAFFYSG